MAPPAFMYRSDYRELAKSVYSASASITTVFLFTRLWARSTKYKGLWWDDYILIAAWACLLVAHGLCAAAPIYYHYNVLHLHPAGITTHLAGLSFMYVAVAISKTAFATTLLRLTAGRIRLVLWAIIIAMNTYTAVMVIQTWIDVCDSIEYPSMKSTCIPATTQAYIVLGNLAFLFVVDLTLTVLPWRMIKQVRFIPEKEKWGVAATMSLVGVSMPISIVKIVILSMVPLWEFGESDFTYGVIVFLCFLQAEAAVFIIAQSVPVIRILWHGSAAPSPRGTRQDESRKVTDTKPVGAAIQGTVRSIELVELPSGRIVAADSEEGRDFQGSQAAVGGEGVKQVTEQPTGEVSMEGHAAADEVHRLWADMGLSRRAYSTSPTPPPQLR
ncbi:hypothetical protein M406DRAFT_107000 [Cryphonectria parasitica EP155]|uniref:Rhodopsin domain-containing protein n=1 Tax=Cryphonectria parasitica (strain ATCC 38755 / EP155) TaxID=660469 RepID=A0A9P5CN39_CRYP1|nr:uncharacterized protein M406DRAFT_107000 [Cryphonectria parasitica EP155]KAF3765049.1 hypothetical protein M406DRAFT_107000 [Cryphonectria parasitica EP155]